MAHLQIAIEVPPIDIQVTFIAEELLSSDTFNFIGSSDLRIACVYVHTTAGVAILDLTGDKLHIVGLKSGLSQLQPKAFKNKTILHLVVSWCHCLNNHNVLGPLH